MLTYIVLIYFKIVLSNFLEFLKRKKLFLKVLPTNMKKFLFRTKKLKIIVKKSKTILFNYLLHNEKLHFYLRSQHNKLNNLYFYNGNDISFIYFNTNCIFSTA